MADGRRMLVWVMTACLTLTATRAKAELGPANVLLIVNPANGDSTAIRTAYLERYPDVRVWDQYQGPSSVTIDRATYLSELRDPLDAYLRNTYDDQGETLWKTIRVLVTTKGIPRRIDDFDNPGVGDAPFEAQDDWGAGRYDAASVDSDLTLLHQTIQPGAEPGTSNYANNHVRNPYHGETRRIEAFDRSAATTEKSLTFNGANAGWENLPGPPESRLTPGDVYLVTRITAYTAAKAIAALDRAGSVPLGQATSKVVLDRDGVKVYDDDPPYSLGEDFPETRDVLQAAGFSVELDSTSTFIRSAARPLIGYSGYGVSHQPAPPSPRALYVFETLEFDLCPGAVFNTYESFNGRDFEAADPYDPLQHDVQAQVADWIHVGGTLGLGHVYEPFTFSVGDNAVLMERMFVSGWTFAESAYACLPLLSWQNIVVGDPLTRFYLAGEIEQWEILADHGPAGEVATGVEDGSVEPRGQGLHALRITFNRDVDPATVAPNVLTILGDTYGDLSSSVLSTELDGAKRLLTVRLSPTLPDADRYTITVTDQLLDTEGLRFGGDLALRIDVLKGDADGSRAVSAADVLAVRNHVGAAVDSATARYDVDGSGAITGSDLLEVRSRLGQALP